MGLFIFSLLILITGTIIFLFGATKLKINDPAARISGITGWVLGFIFLILSMVKVIDAGEVGVVVVFGNVQNRVLQMGINFVPPYADVYKYTTRIHEFTQVEGNIIDVRVSNGLNVSLDCTALYAVDPKMVVEIYTKIAQTPYELQAKILQPTLRTVIRNVVSNYTSEEVYSSKREDISNEIEKELRDSVSSKGILIDKFFIRAIKLPEEVDKAIQMKISAQQEAEAMTFRKQKAEQEAEIKVIEAEGLAKAQRIINSTLTPNYLQHEAIQSYKELAGSQNTTFVIMPTSPNATGMPLILNSGK